MLLLNPRITCPSLRLIEWCWLIAVISLFPPTISLFSLSQPLFLNNIAKLTINFLWGRNGNNNAFRTIGWDTTTLSKYKGGLGVRNLRHVKFALMAKNVFVILNSKNKLWVDIFKNKYGNWFVWNCVASRNASWFHNSICKVDDVLKPIFRMITCNPQLTDFWKDPCLLDLPIYLKPTFLNIWIPKDFSLGDLLNDGDLNFNLLENLFGPSLDWSWISIINFEFSAENNWIWWPCSLKASIAPTVYDYLNDNSPLQTFWKGCYYVWGLTVIPHVKMFIWKLA